jgi:hypothetical protein
LDPITDLDIPLSRYVVEAIEARSGPADFSPVFVLLKIAIEEGRFNVALFLLELIESSNILEKGYKRAFVHLAIERRDFRITALLFQKFDRSPKALGFGSYPGNHPTSAMKSLFSGSSRSSCNLS